MLWTRIYRTLRLLFKVDAAEYMLSICGDNALRELSSPGKSGSFFYLTYDDRYMIKTIKKAEVKVRFLFSCYMNDVEFKPQFFCINICLIIRLFYECFLPTSIIFATMKTLCWQNSLGCIVWDWLVLPKGRYDPELTIKPLMTTKVPGCLDLQFRTESD